MHRIALCAALLIFAAVPPAFAVRDAAFLDPGNGNAKADEAIRVDPKSEIDIGETALGQARRTTVFFVNQSTQPVQLQKLVVNSDSNVTAEITNDDCTKQGTLTRRHPLQRRNLGLAHGGRRLERRSPDDP